MTEPDPARERFWMLNFMRLGGMLFVLAAVLILSGRIPGPEILGYGLLLFGAVEFFALPYIFAKRWKSPDA